MKRDTRNKRPVGLRVAPPVLDMVDALAEWLGAPSKGWIWETAIIRWYAEEQAARQAAQGETPALYELLSDAAAALVAEPAGRDLDAAVYQLAGEIVAFGVGAGLTLGELRALAANLQNELTDAIVREVGR